MTRRELENGDQWQNKACFPNLCLTPVWLLTSYHYSRLWSKCPWVAICRCNSFTFIWVFIVGLIPFRTLAEKLGFCLSEVFTAAGVNSKHRLILKFLAGLSSLSLHKKLGLSKVWGHCKISNKIMNSYRRTWSTAEFPQIYPWAQYSASPPPPPTCAGGVSASHADARYHSCLFSHENHLLSGIPGAEKDN